MTGSNTRTIVGIAGIILLAAVIGVASLFYVRQKKDAAVTSYESCTTQGYPTTGSNPKKCTGPGGKIYYESPKNEATDEKTSGRNSNQQPTTTPPPVQNTERETIALSVYFAKNPESLNDFAYTKAVSRTSNRADMGTYTIEQLIAGPTREEATLGLFSPLKDKLQGTSNCSGKDFTLSVANTIARLKFCRTVASAGIGDDARITSTTTNTLRQFSSVNSVILLTSQGDCFGDMSGQNKCLEE